jgi:methionine-rich copper-binding protein CopC
MIRGSLTGGFLAFAALLAAADAQGVRDFTRSKPGTTTPLTETQAAEVTLTLTDVQFRPIQTWVRAAGKPDGNTVTVRIKGAQALLVEPGQRLRAFSVLSRAQMLQGRVTKVSKTDDGVAVQAELARPLFGDPTTCVVEIVTEAGPYLSIPNVSIIDEGEEKVVYLKGEGGGYNRRAIKTGVQGELYTQVTEGLAENDEVVSVGSFFVDADQKLKSTGGMPPMPGMDHGAMPGMDHGDMQMVQATPKDIAAAGPLKLVMTDPAASSTVGSPMMIHVRFNRPVDAAKSKIDILDSKGTHVAASDAEPMSRDGTVLMIMPAARLAPGEYKVAWRTAGPGTGPLEGAFTFKVN